MHNTINKHVFTLTLLPFLLHVAAHTVPPAHLNSHNAKSAQSELDVPWCFFPFFFRENMEKRMKSQAASSRKSMISIDRMCALVDCSVSRMSWLLSDGLEFWPSSLSDEPSLLARSRSLYYTNGAHRVPYRMSKAAVVYDNLSYWRKWLVELDAGLKTRVWLQNHPSRLSLIPMLSIIICRSDRPSIVFYCILLCKYLLNLVISSVMTCDVSCSSTSTHPEAVHLAQAQSAERCVTLSALYCHVPVSSAISRPASSCSIQGRGQSYLT